MLKKIILVLTFIIITIAACSPVVKIPVATKQQGDTPVFSTLTKMQPFTVKTITPTPTNSYLRSISGSIAVMSGGLEKGIGLLNLESGEIQNLFPDGGFDSLSWSPDGKQIAFDGVNRSSGNPISHIFILTVDGKELKQLTDGNQAEYSFDWSPDGTQIAYEYESNGASPELGLFRISDSVSRQITSTKGAEVGPSFSPDGKTLAYLYIEDNAVSAVKVQLMLMDIKSRKSWQVPLNVPVASPQQVSWSPDGKTIAFISSTLDDRCGDIYFTAPDGSGLIRMTSLINCATQVLWSPDGKYLAFVARDKKHGNIMDWGWQIYVMDSPGQNIMQVTHEKSWIVRDIDWEPTSTCKQSFLGC